MNKGKYYVLLTIPTELRQHFTGRKQLKRSTGTSDLRDAKRRQHGIATGLYAQLDACKPDIRDMISDLLGWIGVVATCDNEQFGQWVQSNLDHTVHPVIVKQPCGPQVTLPICP